MNEGSDPGFARVKDYLLYSLSVPERALRSATGLVGGTLRESASLLVPQAFRSSQTYTVMVQQMLDFLAEDVGGVERRPGASPSSAAVEGFVARKAVGNFVDMAGLATLHLSPMFVLAVVSDLAYGSKTYLRELAGELKRQGVIDRESTIDKVDDLLAAVNKAAATTANAFNAPPLSTDGLARSVEETRSALAKIDPTSVLPQAELQRLWDDIHQIASREGLRPLAVSGAMAMYTLDRVGQIGRGALSTVRAAGSLLDRHVLDHYAEALRQIHQRGVYKFLAETSKPYIAAVWSNFSARKTTFTQELLSGRLLRRAFGAVRGRFGRSGR
jgi:hypothetical protein